MFASPVKLPEATIEPLQNSKQIFINSRRYPNGQRQNRNIQYQKSFTWITQKVATAAVWVHRPKPASEERRCLDSAALAPSAHKHKKLRPLHPDMSAKGGQTKATISFSNRDSVHLIAVSNPQSFSRARPLVPHRPQTDFTRPP